ncbi:MAG: transglutaminase family protein [Sphingomonadales bacterium]|nr:transglutaminase family protein [Sphingomonadales bacterium]MDE2567546.1 transglutaminase family protein [Sphingomonadales bacterium]
MKYAVRHRSKLSYQAPVSDARLNLRLRPVEWPGQVLLSQSLTIDPPPAAIRRTTGPYLTNLDAASFACEVRDLTVESRFEITVDPPPPANQVPAIAEVRSEALVSRDLSVLSPAPYLFGSRIAALDRAITDWAAPLLDPARDVMRGALDVAHAIHEQFAYVPGKTTSATLPHEAFAARSGVCQDFAHVMIVALRGHGIPAGYVSGYLRTLPPPGKPRLVGADAMHAWIAVWAGSRIGWVGVDPTNDCAARDSHIVVAMGRDYADVAPIDGVFIGSAPQRIAVAVDVEEIA